MGAEYDMCVDYDTLCEVHDKLKKIEFNLIDATNQMQTAIEKSKGFLAGNQFEKAKNTTTACLEVSKKTSINIHHAMDYIESLKDSLDEYGSCSYEGEA